MPNDPVATPVLHEWYIEVMLGTISATVCAATEDEATKLAERELEGKLYDQLAYGTWYVQDEGEVDMSEDEIGAGHD